MRLIDLPIPRLALFTDRLKGALALARRRINATREALDSIDRAALSESSRRTMSRPYRVILKRLIRLSIRLQALAKDANGAAIYRVNAACDRAENAFATLARSNPHAL